MLIPNILVSKFKPYLRLLSFKSKANAKIQIILHVTKKKVILPVEITDVNP